MRHFKGAERLTTKYCDVFNIRLCSTVNIILCLHTDYRFHIKADDMTTYVKPSLYIIS